MTIPPPPKFNFVSFSCSFWGQFEQIIVDTCTIEVSTLLVTALLSAHRSLQTLGQFHMFSSCPSYQVICTFQYVMLELGDKMVSVPCVKLGRTKTSQETRNVPCV